MKILADRKNMTLIVMLYVVMEHLYINNILNKSKKYTLIYKNPYLKIQKR